jgi:erythromycin esterase-like protein
MEGRGARHLDGGNAVGSDHDIGAVDNAVIEAEREALDRTDRDRLVAIYLGRHACSWRCSPATAWGMYKLQLTLVRMRHFRRVLGHLFFFPFCVLLIACLAIALHAQNQIVSVPIASAAIDPAVQAMCSKKIVLIGEPPVHGFGKTLSYKTQLVHRLVSECHFDAVFFESGMYDYLHIEHEQRAGQDVWDAEISAAIGGLWANEEVQSLVPFLRERINAGSLTMGGLDDQIGSGSYASKGMASDFVQGLDDKEKLRCLAVLQRHLLWQYSDEPYRLSDKEKILGCLNEIESRLPPIQQGVSLTNDTRAMIGSLERNLARDFTEDDFSDKKQELKWTNDRDRSMYQNFKWLMNRLPPHSKVIVWAATVHTAKTLRGVSGLENRIPLGFLIDRDYGHKAFSLGFSTYAGDYSFTHHPVQHLAVAPPSSLEGKIIPQSHSDVVYLSRQQLHKEGALAARIVGTDFAVAHWDKVLDGLVIFRKERPPRWLNRR